MTTAPKEHESILYYEPMILTEDGLLKPAVDNWSRRGRLFNEHYPTIEAAQRACEKEGGWVEYVIIPRVSVREKL